MNSHVVYMEQACDGIHSKGLCVYVSVSLCLCVVKELTQITSDNLLNNSLWNSLFLNFGPCPFLFDNLDKDEAQSWVFQKKRDL